MSYVRKRVKLVSLFIALVMVTTSVMMITVNAVGYKPPTYKYTTRKILSADRVNFKPHYSNPPKHYLLQVQYKNANTGKIETFYGQVNFGISNPYKRLVSKSYKVYARARYVSHTNKGAVAMTTKWSSWRQIGTVPKR